MWPTSQGSIPKLPALAVIAAALLARTRIATIIVFAVVTVGGVSILRPASAEPARFWINRSGAAPIPTNPGSVEVDLLRASSPGQGEEATFDIWAQPASDTNGIYKQLHDMTLNVVSDAPIIDFLDNSILVANPLLDTDLIPSTPSTKRFSHVRDSSVSNPSNPAFEMHTKTPAEILAGEADAIVGLQGLNLIPTATAASVGFGGGCLDDDNACIDTTNFGPVCALATFTVSSLTEAGANSEPSTTAIHLQIGSGGMRHAGETSADTNVIFAPPGQNEPSYNAGPSGERGIPPKEGDLAELVIRVSDILVGDYNGNGAVDAADYTVWRNRLGTMQPLINRSSANNGAISMADYDAWKANYGRVLSNVAAAESVPEPETGTLVLLLFSFAICQCSQCRRRSMRAAAIHPDLISQRARIVRQLLVSAIVLSEICLASDSQGANILVGRRWSRQQLGHRWKLGDRRE